MNSSKLPDLRYDEDADQEEDDVERQSHLDIVRELVPTDTLHQEVGLVANRRAESRRGRHTDTDEERHGVALQLLCHGEGERE